MGRRDPSKKNHNVRRSTADNLEIQRDADMDKKSWKSKLDKLINT